MAIVVSHINESDYNGILQQAVAVLTAHEKERITD